MPEISRIKDSYYIVATSSLIDPHRLIQKDGDIFGVFDRFGDILPLGKNEQGLYYGGTRFLSFYELRLNGKRPLFLSSDVDEENILLSIDLTNPDIYEKGRLVMSRDTVHIMRSRVLCEKGCFEHIRLKNFGKEELAVSLEIAADADFKDIFEIRGMKRKKRGKRLKRRRIGAELKLAYRGLDRVKRTTTLRFTRPPDSASNDTLRFGMTLRPDGIEDLYIMIDCSTDSAAAGELHFEEAAGRARRRLRNHAKNTAEIFTSNEQFNESIKRAVSDINMMLTGSGHDMYPYGGIPWFCAPFGRDGIITALECLWIKPDLARGVLLYLAERQARDLDPAKAAQPGKIMHEARGGEMAALGEIPFGLYYGSVDSTPLYLILAGEYYKRTGDAELIRSLWPRIKEAAVWLDRYGDVDGDGFMEYVPDAGGLRNQGWKDSQDSVFHSDGALAEGPIALCEVQGYLYAAKKAASMLSRLMGDEDWAARLQREAEELRSNFNRTFWDERLGTYVLALDGDKKPCRVLASNAGHTLFSGIADHDKAKKVARTLTSEALYSGWGIRTLASTERLYNPMSYHNGSVWPHDNALTGFGLACYGLREDFSKVFTGVFDASLFMDLHRLPELFCGFQRRPGMAPTLYPVACSPQTWASGSLLLMLQASLGIHFEAENKRIIFKESMLPGFLEEVRLKNLAVTPGKSVDLLIRRYGDDFTIETLKKPFDVSIHIIK